MFGIDTQQGTVVSSCVLNMHDLVSETFAFLFYKRSLCFFLCFVFCFLQMLNKFSQVFFSFVGGGEDKGHKLLLITA